MKYLTATILALFVSFCSAGAIAGMVNGYTKSNGTYVHSYYRSSPNYTVRDNYTYINNYNPYTCLLYTSPSPRDRTRSRMPSSA